MNFGETIITIPAFVFFVIAAVSITYFLTDRTALTKLQSAVIISLRSIIYGILLFLLLSPVLPYLHTVVDKPEIAVAYDISESMSIETERYSGLEAYRQSFEQFLNNADTSSVSYSFLPFHESVESPQQGITSLPEGINRDQTNISNLLNALSYEQQYDALVLFSDGNVTSGADPVFAAEEFNRPVFSIGLGDSTAPQDLIAYSLNGPSSVFVNSTFSLSAVFRRTGFENGQNVEISLYRNNERIDQIEKTFDDNQEFLRHSFDITANEEHAGLQQYRAEITSENDEFTDQNNAQSVTVEIIDDKSVVVQLAYSIHPDAKTVRSILEEIENIDFHSYFYLGNNRYLNRPDGLSINPDTVDLFIIHDLPSTRVSNRLSGSILEYTEQIPAIFIAGPDFSTQSFTDLGSRSPVRFDQRGSLREAEIALKGSQLAHPVLDSLNQIPLPQQAIMSYIDAFLPKAESQNYLLASYQGNVFDDSPLATSVIDNGVRYSFLNMVGFNKLYRSTVDSERTFITKLIRNLTGWTLIPDNNELLQIDLSDKSYTEAEDIVINAVLKNEDLSLESDASISLTLMNDAREPRSYSFESLGGGTYQLNLGSLSSGTYSFNAEAVKGGISIDDAEGSFVVSETNVEYTRVQRNEQLLRNISYVTGGSYLDYSNSASVIDSIATRINMDQNVNQITVEYPLNELIYWFIAALLLLTTEWGLRKYWLLS